ncbi:hypothetical protein D3C80_1682410 [compost metagenome]
MLEVNRISRAGLASAKFATRRATCAATMTATLGLAAKAAKPNRLTSGRTHSVATMPAVAIILPVMNSWNSSVIALTIRSILAKNAVRAARSGNEVSAMLAC